MEIDISVLNAEEVLPQECVQDYRKGMEALYRQLVHLNTNIFILERIAEFPFSLFVTPGESIFLRMVFANFASASLLIITRIATDTDVDLLTLPQFKNWLRQHVRDQYKDAFDARLKAVRFNKETIALLKRAKQVRDEQLAHLTRATATGTSEASNIFLSELKSLRDALNSLMDALAFNVDHLLLPLEYSPRVSSARQARTKPDIERLLDCIAQRSALLNMPESNPEEWNHQRKRLSSEEVAILNQYRKKFGLPEA